MVQVVGLAPTMMLLCKSSAVATGPHLHLKLEYLSGAAPLVSFRNDVLQTSQFAGSVEAHKLKLVVL